MSCFISFRIRTLFGLLAAKVDSFLKRHMIQSADCTTASKTVVRVGEKVKQLESDNTSLRLFGCLLQIFHQLRASFHMEIATMQFTRIWFSVSRLSSQTEHLTESRSIPLLSRFTLVGILLFSILYVEMLTLMGTSLYHLVGVGWIWVERTRNKRSHTFHRE